MFNEGKHSLKRVKQCTMYPDSRRFKWIFGMFNCKKDMGHVEDAEDSDDSSGHRGQQNVPGLVNLEFPLYQQVTRRLRKRLSLKVSSNLRESGAVSLLAGAAAEHATKLNLSVLQNYELVQKDEPVLNTRNQTRREKEFEIWKKNRESLLTCRIDEEF